jgi:hypothetical protein
MVDAMKVNINMIKSMVSEHFIGLMEESMSDIGKMENNMEEENIFYQMEKKK